MSFKTGIELTGIVIVPFIDPCDIPITIPSSGRNKSTSVKGRLVPISISQFDSPIHINGGHVPILVGHGSICVLIDIGFMGIEVRIKKVFRFGLLDFGEDQLDSSLHARKVELVDNTV